MLRDRAIPVAHGRDMTSRVWVRAALIALGISAATAALAAPNWVPLRKDDATALSIDRNSIRRSGDRVSFRYLVDHRRTQGDIKTFMYRSLVVRASIRCKARTLSLGMTEAYVGPGGKGPQSGYAPATKENARYEPIEAGTSDEDLWRYLCEPSAAKKSAPPAR